MSYERDNIRRMQGYQWGEQPEDGDAVKLNTNENPYPPSPRVQEALSAVNADVLRTYPRPTADPLRDLLAIMHGLTRDHVLVTHGGDEGLRLAMTTFVDPGATFAMASPSYSLYPVLAQIQDARLFTVDLDLAWQLPADTALRLNDAGARLTCLVNPHAPSGTLTAADRLAGIARDLDGVMLVDEAYVDFVDPELGHDLTGLVRELPNLLLLRTFSKGYSLAGLRLGYLLGHPDLIDPMISRTRDSYNVDAISQALGEAAVRDRAYAEDTWAKVRAARQALHDGLAQIGLAPAQSQSNFLLVQVPPGCTRSARELYEHLKTRDILVRYFDVPGLDDRLRISVGTPVQNQRLIAALGEALHG
jgi:histidinol-phosphate aminotransferase